MKKVIATTVLLTAILLSATAGYAYPEITHMFYDNTTKGLYVFSETERGKDSLADAGVYINGDKYSVVNEEGDSKKLDKINSSVPHKFGLGFLAPVKYFHNLLLTPYVVFDDGKEILGAPKSYDEGVNSMQEGKIVFFDNFTKYSEKELPEAIKLTAYKGTSVEIKKHADQNGIEKNMLFMNDTATANSVKADITLPEYGESLMLEMRFKIDKTNTEGFGFIMDFTGNGNRAFRLIKYADTVSNGFTYVNNSSYNVSGKEKKNFDGEWFTLKLRIDTKRHINQIMVLNDYYRENTLDVSANPFSWQNKEKGYLLNYNLLWYNEFEDEKIDTISFLTYSKSCGEYYIDYIKLVSDVEEFKPLRERAPSKYIETIPDPVPIGKLGRRML